MRTGTPLTGRQVHALLKDQHSLWSVQEALKTLTLIGVVVTQTVGRAGLHSVNESHAAAAPLRSLLSPVAALTDIVGNAVGNDTEAVLLFGSIARGEATLTSDIDLAARIVRLGA